MSSIPQNSDYFPTNTEKFCPRCERWLSTAQFGKRSSEKDGLRRICKSCRRDEYIKHSKEIIQKHRDLFLAKSPDEQKDIRTRQNKQYRERSMRKRQDGMCASCLIRPAENGRFICQHCQDKHNRYSDHLRDEVIAAYGGVCAICGESHPAFLSVDHINNDGAEHRRMIGGGHRLYRWLRKNDFPQEEFQLLCSNCNWLKYASRSSREQNHHALWYARLRQETFAAYGGKCVCCGESRAEVLTIDHINNDGAEHRRQIGGGISLYMWLCKQGFPQEGFQALCFNCNRARYYYGVCPHQQ